MNDNAWWGKASMAFKRAPRPEVLGANGRQERPAQSGDHARCHRLAGCGGDISSMIQGAKEHSQGSKS